MRAGLLGWARRLGAGHSRARPPHRLRTGPPATDQSAQPSPSVPAILSPGEPAARPHGTARAFAPGRRLSEHKGTGDERDIRRHHHRHRTSRAAAGQAPRCSRHAGRHRRAPSVRRHLREHRMHSDQDDGGQRLCGAHGAKGRRFRRGGRWRGPRRHGAGQGEEGRDLRPVEGWARTLACGHSTSARSSPDTRDSPPPHEVQVGASRLRAERIFINVGARAAVPPLEGLDQVPYLTNSSMMALDAAPPHLIIVGGSYIGLEFGQMFRRFGSKVTIIEKGPRLVDREDHDVADAICGILTDEGIDVRLNAECISVSESDGEISAGFNSKASPQAVTGSHLLIATGRRPNTDDLGLDAGGHRSRCPAIHRGRQRAAHQRRGHLGARRLQRQGRIHPHVVQRFRDCRVEPARRRATRRRRPDPGVRALHRSAARPCRPHRARRARARASRPGRTATDDAHQPGGGKGRDQRPHEDRGRRRLRGDPRSGGAGNRRRRGRFTAFST